MSNLLRTYSGLHIVIPILLYHVWVSNHAYIYYILHQLANFNGITVIIVINALGLYIFLSRLEIQVNMGIQYR
jgi:hypothetical protein